MSAKVKSAGHPKYKNIIFSWELTDECQYNCEYCYVKEILTKKISDDIKHVYNGVLDRLELKSTPDFRMEILGGEPTTHPNFEHILERLEKNNKCKNLSVNTNFAKPLKYYQKFCDSKYKKLEFSISVHSEYLFRREDKFIKKVIEFNKLPNTRVFVNVNLHKDIKYFEMYEKIITQLIDNGLHVGVNYLFTTRTYLSEYENAHFEKIENIVTTQKQYLNGVYIDHDKYPYVFDDGKTEQLDLHEINRRNLKSFKGYNCRPKLWYINRYGAFKNTCTGKVLDVLYRNVNECVECPCDKCACDMMLNYHKTAPGEIKPTC